MSEAPQAGFHTGIELTSDAILMTDALGRVTFGNPAAEQMFGKERFLGRYVGTMFETSVDTSEAYVQRALDGLEQRVPAVVRAHDGERHAILLRIAPIGGGHETGNGRAATRSDTDDEGEDPIPSRPPMPSEGVVAVLEDVTEEFRARQAIAKSEMRYRNIFDGASDAIYTLDSTGAFTSVNGATCRMSGYGADELIGYSLAPLLDEDERQMIVEHFRAARNGEPRNFDCHVTRKDGVRVLCSVTHTPIRSDDEIIGVLGIARDVTDQRRAAQEREELRRQLGQSQKLEAIGQLVSGVAHELNNPLAAVMAYAQLVLTSRTLPEDERGAVETMLQETKRAVRIVSNLLTFARQHQPERAVTDLNQVVSDTVALRRFALNERSITLTVDLDERLPLTWADSFQVQQVLLNLVTNAEQALSDWSGERRITVTTRYEGQKLRLIVSDSGPGIDDTTLDQIFNPFFTTKGVGEGTGLGLSIADGIMREHGGRIRAESKLGHGATFIVELPFVDPASGFLYAAAQSSNSDAGDLTVPGVRNTSRSPFLGQTSSMSPPSP